MGRFGISHFWRHQYAINLASICEKKRNKRSGSLVFECEETPSGNWDDYMDLYYQFLLNSASELEKSENQVVHAIIGKNSGL